MVAASCSMKVNLWALACSGFGRATYNQAIETGDSVTEDGEAITAWLPIKANAFRY